MSVLFSGRMKAFIRNQWAVVFQNRGWEKKLSRKCGVVVDKIINIRRAVKCAKIQVGACAEFATLPILCDPNKICSSDDSLQHRHVLTHYSVFSADLDAHLSTCMDVYREQIVHV